MGSQKTGATRLTVRIILAVIIATLLGVLIWWTVTLDSNNVATVNETAQQETASNEAAEDVTPADISTDTPDAAVKTGTLTGSLTYPSDAIPADVVVYAENLDTGKVYQTKERVKAERFQYGTGYELEVPVGRYYVYGAQTSNPGDRAYYNQVIVCGIKAECTDTTKVEVVVKEGQRTIDATVGDWWTQPE